MTEIQSIGQDQSSNFQFGHEVIGTLYGCTFDISTVVPVNTYRLDGRICQSLQAGMSAIDFQRLLAEHNVLSITFSWDARELAREVFHLLAIGYKSNEPTIYPREVH